MPKTHAEIKRIERLHENGDHERCSTDNCEDARQLVEAYMAEGFEERELAAEDRGLLDELAERGVDPRLLLDYEERIARIAKYDPPADDFYRIRARTNLKLGFVYFTDDSLNETVWH